MNVLLLLNNELPRFIMMLCHLQVRRICKSWLSSLEDHIRLDYLSHH